MKDTLRFFIAVLLSATLLAQPTPPTSQSVTATTSTGALVSPSNFFTGNQAAIAAVVGNATLTTTQIQAANSAGLTLKNAAGANVLLLGPGPGTGATFYGGITGATFSLGSNTLTGTSLQLATAISDETGSGALVFGTSPTLTTPILGAATATSITAPATTDLTLTGGSSGASLVLGQGATSGATITGKGAQQGLSVTNTAANQASIYLRASDLGSVDWRIHNSSGRLGFENPSGSAATSFYATLTGNLLLGTTTDMSGSGGLKVAGTTASTSTTTGSGIFGGGIGVAGAINAGDDIKLRKDATGAASYVIDNRNTAGSEILYLTEDGVSANYAYIGRINSAGSPARQVRFGAGDAVSWNFVNGNVNVSSTTSATSSTVGALTIGNGTAATNVAIGGGKINAGADLAAVGISSSGGISNTVSGDSNLRLTSTTAVTGRDWYLRSTSSGAFDVFDNTGGGRRFSIDSTGVATFGSTVSGTSTTAAAILGKSMGLTENLFVGGSINLGGAATFLGNVTVGSTTKTSNSELIIASDPGYIAGLVFAQGSENGWEIYQPASSDELRFFRSGIGDTFKLTNSGTATFSGSVTVGGVTILKNYTVATLPAAASYTYGEAYVSDATQAAGTSIGSAPTGGGSVVRGVYSNGSAWLLR